MQNQSVSTRNQKQRTRQSRLMKYFIRYNCLALVCLILLFALQLTGGTINSQPAQSSEKLKLLLPLGHTGPITALSYSPDGKLLASAGADGNIFISSPP